MNNCDATKWTFVLNRVMHISNVTIKRVTNRKEMTTQRTFMSEKNKINNIFSPCERSQ